MMSNKNICMYLFMTLLLFSCDKRKWENPVDPSVLINPPILLSPSEYYYTNDNTPIFTWFSVTQGAHYHLQIADNNSFVNPKVNIADIQSTTFVIVDTLADGDYFWHVRARFGEDRWGEWSELASFTIKTRGPSAPDLLSPADGNIINDNTPLFDWTDVNGVISYEVIVDDSTDFESPVINQKNLINSEYSPSEVLPDGTYHWKARGRDQFGNIGLWSVVQKITIDTKQGIFMTDIDGNKYRIVKIGSQWWMAENLKVTHYRNGDAIENVIGNSAWTNLAAGAYCNYNNKEDNVAIYGRLYNWYAVNDNRNIAPTGWHVPSDAEWKQLEIILGMNQTEADKSGWRGTSEGGKLKEAGTTHWESPNTGATNESGFSALPGGYRNYGDGNYYYLTDLCYFWTTTQFDLLNACSRHLRNYYSTLNREPSNPKILGFSVRCVGD